MKCHCTNENTLLTKTSGVSEELNYLQIDQLGPITDRRAEENSEISSPPSFLGQQQGTVTAHTVDYTAKMLL